MSDNRTVALYTHELSVVKILRDKICEYVVRGLKTNDYQLKDPNLFSDELLGMLAMAVDWDYSGSETRQEMYADKLFWAGIAASGCLRTIKRSLKLCDWETYDVTALKHIVAHAIAIVMRPMKGKR